MTSESAARLIVYERSERTCEVCGRPGESVHHRMKQGRPWEPGNLLMLCGDGTRRCHGWIENQPTYAKALGLWLPRGADWSTAPAYIKPRLFTRGWWTLDDDGCLTYAGDPPDGHPGNPGRAAAILALTAARLPG